MGIVDASPLRAKRFPATPQSIQRDSFQFYESD